MLDPGDLDGDLAELYAAYRAELDRLGLWDRDLLRRRAAERLAVRPRRLARRARVRLRLRRSDRRRVVAARGARRPGRRPGLAALRAGPGRVRVARPHSRRPRRGSRTAGSRSCRPGRPSTRIPRSRISSARCSRSLRRRPPTSTPRFASSKGAGARGTLELVGDELTALIRGGTPPERIALVAPSPERWRAPLETVFGGLGDPLRDRVTRPPRCDAVRPRAAAAPPLRLARRRAPRAVRLPALAVFRPRPRVGRLRRGPAARTRYPHARARRGGGREAARGAGAGAGGAARRRRRRSPACARSSVR